jgi:hypothetical protein
MSFLPGFWLHPKASPKPGRKLKRLQAEADPREAGGLYTESGKSKQGSSYGAQQRIVARLSEAERDYEALRRERSPAYRSGKHVQILSALIAEADRAAGNRPTLSRSCSADQTKASGSDALRLAM